MPLALGFGELLMAVILVIAGVTGSSIGSVVRGNPDHAAGDDTAGAQDSVAATKLAPDAATGQAGSTPLAAGITAGSGTASFEGHTVAAWIAPILAYGREHGWTGTVSSGYRTDAQQTQIYDSGVRPAAVPRSEGGSGSNHEGSAFPLGAVDVTQAAQLSAILATSPFRSLLVWAGSKDPVHFSHPHNGSY